MMIEKYICFILRVLDTDQVLQKRLIKKSILLLAVRLKLPAVSGDMNPWVCVVEDPTFHTPALQPHSRIDALEFSTASEPRLQPLLVGNGPK